MLPSGDSGPGRSRAVSSTVVLEMGQCSKRVSARDESLDITQWVRILLRKSLARFEVGLVKNCSGNGGTDSPWFNSGGPFRSDQGFAKGNVNEGGIRVPMIASWPRRIKPGAVSGHISSFWDVMPTFCEIAGIKTPDDADGISFLPELTGGKQEQHEYLYWEFPESGGQQAVITGNYKAMRKNMHKGNSEFELYDLKNDMGETSNIASLHPEIMKKIEEIVTKEHKTSANRLWSFKLLDK